MIPVTLLTGFLGSGKTTLLQRLLTDPGMARAAVLINEFGEVGLDHHLLDRIDDNVVLMKSGCICCTVRGEVADALMNLHSLLTRGEIDFDRVVIETTGLADPYPVLQTLRAHPVLRSHFDNGGVLTTVDAVNATRQVEHRAEAVRQIAAADRIVLTKTDLAEDGEIAALRATLSRLNPSARVLTNMDAADAIVRDLDPGVPPLPEAEKIDGHHHHHDHDLNEDLGVVTFSLTVEENVDWTDFGIWLTLLLHRYGDRIFRFKGILAIAGEERPVAVHGVQHLVHAPVHMEHWPEGARVSRMVFILEGLDPERIRRSFAAFMRLKSVKAVA
ncbi:G3E family GTPase [Thioclava sp. ES.031]|uniref:Cobalamin biosynthesis protein CobW n=1 Tax=Thioclava nitratireducens TaxID=1915078 RepID=A0ABN4X7V7_9RHOB|nr:MULTISPECIES: GTP-binding protein [Thioclava]AQS48552.1 cobalamin biosynthesis protein CobW [Thioclava nitratireducens]PFG63715.1 G3E family GTPase [Thioclava sp. ES.031]